MADRLVYDLNKKLLSIEGFRVFNADYREVGEEWKSMVGYFPYYRLYYIFDSKDAFVTLKSETIQLLPNHIYYIPAFKIVSGKCKLLKHSFIHFFPDLLVGNILENFNKVIDLEAQEDSKKLFQKVIDNYEKNSISSKFATSGAIQFLLSSFLYDSTKIENKSKTKFLLVIEYIDNNIDKKITVDELAGVLGYNKTYFSNCFKAVFGVAPMQYVINRKVEVASRILLSSDDSVSEIAFSLGFDNALYFSRVFKIKTKMSPKKYRLAYKEK